MRKHKETDKEDSIRKGKPPLCENPAVETLYTGFLEEPSGHKSHELLLTCYHELEKVKS
ncbi:MAG: hypothetical protein DRP70_08210 [Spirochaetes bacterium]|nr:MAG: hypothetical protein DRP70_08210 [Spirochaetota bacterium]